MGVAETLGLLFEINADPQHAITAMQLLEEELTTKLSAALGVSQKSLKEYGDAGLAAIKDVAAIGGAATVVGGALFAAAEHAAHFAEEIGHVSERSGATTEQVSTLRFEADRFNVSSEAVSRGLNFFAKNLDIAATTGKGQAAPAFRDLGVALEDSAGHVRSVSAVLPEVIDKLGRMEAGARKTYDTMAIFGRGGAELIPALDALGTQGFGKVTKQAEQFGRVVHQNDVQAAHEFLFAQRELNAEPQAFALRLGGDVMPWLTQLLIKLENLPLLLAQIGLDFEKVGMYISALPTAGASLLELPIINKRIAETTKLMDQAITDALVKFQKEAEAARQASEALEKQSHAIHGSGLADDIREYLIPALEEAAEKEREYAKTTEESAERSSQAGMSGVVSQSVSLLATLGLRRQAAAVETIWETAKAFAALGVHDYWGAAQHFISQPSLESSRGDRVIMRLPAWARAADEANTSAANMAQAAEAVGRPASKAWRPADSLRARKVVRAGGST